MMTNKPLPTICPECGAKANWRLERLFARIGDDYFPVDVRAYVCDCGYIAELFQDTGKFGRRKFVPVEG